MHARRSWFSFAVVLSAGATLLLASSPVVAQTIVSPSDAEGSAMEAFTPGAKFTPAIKPFAANPNATATVVLKMAGDSVAVAQKKSRTKLDDAQREQVRGDLKSRQDAIESDIEANGGTVLAKYQDAYNGVKVQVPASRLPALAALRNVVAVKPVAVHQLENTQSVPFIDAPAAWAGPAGVHGEGVKVGIIDTGIDYTHANFGGPGTEAAFATAFAAKQANQLPDPTWFGPNSPKVKGGVDLVGDAYNAALPPGNPRTIPHPGVNPLDCYGHGSHVAGTTAGFGVTSTGATYHGAYSPSTYSSTSFRVGPGVAPKADLYAIRVFGCEGSTDVVVDALNWAVANRMDVVNMSLGSSYGDPSDPDVEATNNAADAGIIVVASAGNSGPAPYITGSPAIAERAISVAAEDTIAAFPGYNLTLNPGAVSVLAMNANDSKSAPLPGLQIYRMPMHGSFSGCTESEYDPALITGKLVITVRGFCARVDRAIFGARHGAAAVAMINSGSGYPVYEGPIQDPLTHKIVTMPFLGIRGADRAKMNAATTADLGSATTIANSGYKGYASFTSGGPRRGDSMLKPDVTGPGVSIMSTLIGSGNEGTRMSGTSMAAPHVSGVAALVRQAHPDWEQEQQRAAIINTATISPAKVSRYKVSRGGAGAVSAISAVRTQATATTGEDGATALSFGFQERTSDFNDTLKFQVANHGSTPITFNASWVPNSLFSRPHLVTLSAPSITVDPDDSADLKVTLSVKASDVGSAFGFREVSGAIQLTPAAPGMNGDVSLRVPYSMVPRARSNVATELSKRFGSHSTTGTAAITNSNGARSGIASFYAWGLEGKNRELGELGIRAVGAQTDPVHDTLTFAVNTFGRFVTPDVNEYDILIDTTGTGTPNWVLAAIDLGKVTGNGYDGNYVTVLCDLPKAINCAIEDWATAPFNGSTILMPTSIADLGLTAAQPRFTYTAMSFDIRGDRGYVSDSVGGPAKFNAFTPAISSGQPNYAVAVGATVTATISVNAGEWEHTPALGLMIATVDNRSGAAQAQLVRVRRGHAED
jgi:subtilisin family serine protease